jgi:PKD repeat protein
MRDRMREGFLGTFRLILLVLIICFALFSIIGTGGGGGSSSDSGGTSGGDTNGEAPTINTFTASATSVEPGDSFTLSWEVSDADTVSIDQGIGEVEQSGQQDITLTTAGTYTYTLTATNEHGSTTCSVTVSCGSSPLPNSLYVVDRVEDVPLEEIADKHWFPVPAGDLPGQWEYFVQPETGHTILRISSITDDAGFSYMEGDPSQGLTNGYSRFANANIDEAYALAYSTDQPLILYDLVNHRSLGVVTHDGVHPILEASNARWDLSGREGTKTTIYYHLWGESEIFRQDVLAGPSSRELVYQFSENILSEDHMDQDRYARYRAVRLENRIEVLDLRTSQVLPGKVFVDQGGCDVSTEGNWLYVQGFGGTEETRFYRITHLAAGDTGDFVQLPCRSHGHDGWAYDKNGNEVYVFQDNTNDWYSAFNPETQERIDIMHMSETGWNFNQHMGRMYNPEKKGWLLMSSYANDNDSWANNQLFMLEIQSHSSVPKPRIWRIASTYNAYNNQYFAEAFACLSPNGNNIYWGANWMGQDNLELYRVELPSNWHQVLANNE